MNNMSLKVNTCEGESGDPVNDPVNSDLYSCDRLFVSSMWTDIIWLLSKGPVWAITREKHVRIH